jgi:hypothetical protein
MPEIVWNMGGFVAEAHVKDHPTISLSWDLMSGEVFFTGRNKRYAEAKNAKAFKAIASKLFAEVMAE